MILIIDGTNAQRFPNLLKQVHQLRAEVFADRLGWDVNVTDGLERDAFDTLDPAHVVSLDPSGRVVGSMRLLQTTGPHMLADVFSPILQGDAPLRSPHVWEATRFCVDMKRLGRGTQKHSVSYVTSEIMIGAFEYAQKAGVTDAVAVIDPIMNRLLIRSGNAPYDYLGQPTPMGKVTAMAAMLDCSTRRMDAIRQYAGIYGNVFLENVDHDQDVLEAA